MPVFTAAATAIFAGTLFAGTWIVTATAFALQLAAGIGLSLISKAIAGEKQQEPVGIQGKLASGGDVPRSIMLGRYNTAGSLVYHGATGQAGETPNAVYMQVVALDDKPHPGAALSEVWLEGEKLTLVPTTQAQDWGLAALEYRKDNIDHLWFRFYDGTQVAADPWLVNMFGGSARPYGSDRVGHGITYVVVTAVVDDITKENPLFKGFPQCKFTLPGIPLYDPSRDSSVGGVGSQRWSDPSTWGGDGDDLPAVQAYNILRGIYHNGLWLYGLQNASPAILPAQNWIDAINKCRASVDGPDGPEPQYRSGMQINVDVPAIDALQALEKACQGRISEVGGVYRMHVGAPDSAVLSFSDEDIISTEEQQYSPFHSLADSINGVVAKYPEPLEGWNVKTAPPLYNADFEAKDGNRCLMADVDLATVPYHGQVQRLIKSALDEARRERSHTLTLPPWAQCLEPGDIVAWDSARNGYIGKLMRVEGITYKANLDVMIQVVEVDPSDYDWDQDTDYTPPVFAPMGIIRPAPQPIVSWNAEPYTEYDELGIPRRFGALLTWDGNKQDLRGVAYEAATAPNDSSVILRETTDDNRAGAIKVFSPAFIQQQTYYFRGRYIPSAPRDTPFSDWRAVVMPDVRLTDRDINTAIIANSIKIEDYLREPMENINTVFSQRSMDDIAGNWLDKQRVRRDLMSVAGDAKAQITELWEVRTSDQEAFANYQLEVAATFGPSFSTVNTVSQAISDINGWAAARYSVTLDVNGYATGFELINGGLGISSTTFVQDKFQIAAPGVSGGAPKPIFTVALIEGNPSIALRGDVFADGTITARSINVSMLSAITANIGEVTAGKARSLDGKFVIDFDNARIEVWE